LEAAFQPTGKAILIAADPFAAWKAHRRFISLIH
jgi:hypothetical protein